GVRPGRHGTPVRIVLANCRAGGGTGSRAWNSGKRRSGVQSGCGDLRGTWLSGNIRPQSRNGSEAFQQSSAPYSSRFAGNFGNPRTLGNSHVRNIRETSGLAGFGASWAGGRSSAQARTRSVDAAARSAPGNSSIYGIAQSGLRDRHNRAADIHFVAASRSNLHAAAFVEPGDT